MDLYEIKYSIYEWFHDGYIFIKDVFCPWHTMRILNHGRGYTDPDNRMVHAAFSILCRFVEKEFEYGRTDIVYYLAELKAEEQYLHVNQPLIDAYTAFLEAYDWYASIDWDREEPHGIVFTTRAVKNSWRRRFESRLNIHLENICVKYRKYMWT